MSCASTGFTSRHIASSRWLAAFYRRASANSSIVRVVPASLGLSIRCIPTFPLGSR